MEKVRKAVNQIAYTPSSQRLSLLSPLHLSLIPLLSFASSLYHLSLSLRRLLYSSGLLSKNSLGVPVISVGNLTWGGNGKTPMAEFIALCFSSSGISPLILTRGYGGADEARMLERHLEGTSAKIGIGANRALTATSFIKKYGSLNPNSVKFFERIYSHQNSQTYPHPQEIGVAILDDGMQHLSVRRDLEIVMVNGIMPWGNHQLLPLGPLREPLSSLTRADIVVVHHADLVSEENIKMIESTIWKVKESVPICFTRMNPSHFFRVGKPSSRLPLGTIHNRVVLCVSAIGSPDSFVQRIQKSGPLYVDRLDFSDHHSLQMTDIDMINMRLENLHARFGSDPVAVITEKDYDRDQEILEHLDSAIDVLVLCCKLEIMPGRGVLSEDSFKRLAMQLLQLNYQSPTSLT